MFLPIGDENIARGHTPYFSYGFIVLNIAIFIWQSTFPESGYNAFLRDYGMIPAEITVGIDLETLLTSVFLHGDFMHLFGNMLYLWIFADNVEAVVGNFRFVVFYLLGGLAASFAQIYIMPDSLIPNVGASGAISAVLGAYLVMFPKSQIKVLFFVTIFYIPAIFFLGYWFVQQVIEGMGNLGPSAGKVAGVAWWAHIGGFVFGLLIGFYFRTRFVGYRFVEKK
jgi:membrane associated rhomboid family serine protease